MKTKHEIPPHYESKFTEFIRLCDSAKSEGVGSIIIAALWVLGDTHAEIVESLSRLAKADLALRIADTN
jgi:hypothetical protein